MAKKNFYCVIKGRTPGIYTNWSDCEKQVKKFKGAKFKGFATMEQAQQYIQENE